MLGGTTITARTREHAREMLEAVVEKTPADAAAPGGGASRAHPVRAVLAHAVAVQGQRVVGDVEAEPRGDLRWRSSMPSSVNSSTRPQSTHTM